ncbi:MAG: lysophospholipid acyltransferase family protein [Candidatus Omnitrophica bacterium]|nr:lysophospholipid acyltransferase family protein [Candidatus Omnitrophota bacterium]
MFNYTLYRIGQFVALTLPLKFSYWVASLAADTKYLFSRTDRINVGNNLRAIFPEKKESEIRYLRRRVFRNFAKYLVDFFRFEKIDEEYIKKNVKIENLHYFTEELKKEKGIVVLTAHIGNWELGGVVVALSGFPFYAVALPHKTKKVNDFFNSQRQSKKINVIPFGKAVRACLNTLKENKLVALVGDRDFAEKGVILDFFGKPTYFPEGPAAFALKTGASIVPGFMVRNPNDTFTLRIEKPIEYKATQDKTKDILEIISRYKIIFENYIKEYPEQWYVFRPFWAINHEGR